MPNRATPGVYVEGTPLRRAPLARADTSVTAFVGMAAQGPLNTPVRISGFAQFEATFGTLAADHELPWALWQYFLNGGTDAWVVRAADASPQALAGQRSARRGLFALDAADGFGLLCLPGVDDPAVLRAAARYCEERHAFCIIDAPATAQTPADMLRARGALPASSNAALYYPWVVLSHPRGGAARLAPPSGTLAGIYAHTDRTHGVWKAPAGTQARLQGVAQLAHALTNQDLEALNTHGVNCLRDLPRYGPCVWGARTLRPTDPGWKYIAVRRLALLLQRSLLEGLGWVAFEPNDAALWTSVRAAASDFLLALWRDGALQGDRLEHAGFAQCGLGQTMTPDDIARGKARLTVGFAPQRPAEFVVLSLEFTTAG